MGEVRVGDTLFDENGDTCAVTDISDIDLSPKSYLMTFSNGERIRACEDHLWVTRSLAEKSRVTAGGDSVLGRKVYRSRTTDEIRKTLLRGDGARNHSMQMPAPIKCDHATLPVDPYVLGVWLGDGSKHDAVLTTHVSDKDHYERHFRNAGYLFKWTRPQKSHMQHVHRVEVRRS